MRENARGAYYKTIERGGQGVTYRHRDGWTVYQHGTFPRRAGVLAGPPTRTYLRHYDTLAAARAAHPDAEVINGSSYQWHYQPVQRQTGARNLLAPEYV